MLAFLPPFFCPNLPCWHHGGGAETQPNRRKKLTCLNLVFDFVFVEDSRIEPVLFEGLILCHLFLVVCWSWFLVVCLIMISIVRLLKFLKNMPYYLPSWELTYPTLGKRKSSSKGPTSRGYVTSLEGSFCDRIREWDSFGAKKILALEKEQPTSGLCCWKSWFSMMYLH